MVVMIKYGWLATAHKLYTLQPKIEDVCDVFLCMSLANSIIGLPLCNSFHMCCIVKVKAIKTYNYVTLFNQSDVFGRNFCNITCIACVGTCARGLD